MPSEADLIATIAWQANEIRKFSDVVPQLVAANRQLQEGIQSLQASNKELELKMALRCVAVAEGGKT